MGRALDNAMLNVGMKDVARGTLWSICEYLQRRLYTDICICKLV